MSTEYRYPEDEFDVAARDRENVGIHRIPTPLWKRLLPPILVVVLAVALGWGLLKFFGSDGDSGAPSASPTQTQSEGTDDGGDNGSGEGSGDAGGEGQGDAGGEGQGDAGGDAGGEGNGDGNGNEGSSAPVEAEPPAEVHKDFNVSALNGTRINGLAGRTKAKLESVGFTKVLAADYKSAQPTVTTVFYPGEEQKATAEEIAKTLNISQVVENADATGADKIVVVLRQDFQDPGQ